MMLTAESKISIHNNVFIANSLEKTLQIAVLPVYLLFSRTDKGIASFLMEISNFVLNTYFSYLNEAQN